MDSGNGYVGLTDSEWYRFLSAHPQVDEVNFWQPHGSVRFGALRPGEPFFFKLRTPHKAIVGFGFFERFEQLDAWLAWESFGEMNGAGSFEQMMDRIVRLRGEHEPRSRAGGFKIGCIMIAAPVFFRQAEWVDPPTDWARTGIQKGKRYVLDSGEGNRLFRECMDRARRGEHYWNVDKESRLIAEDAARYGQPTLVHPRLGQGLFSLAVRDAYGRACAVTGEHSEPVLEAAHIVPFGRGGEHRVDNGLLLRSDIHRLYDYGYVTVTPDHEFVVGDSLRDDFHNGRTYYGLHGKKVFVPDTAAWRPNRDLLEWHQRQVFKG